MKMNRLVKIVISIILPSLFLSGCSSPPRKIEASVPLVEASAGMDSLGQQLPLIFWKQFATQESASISDSEYTIFASKPYISALDMLCRNLIINDVNKNTRSQRVACSQVSQYELTELSPWYLMRDIKNPMSDLKL
ncbi:hypothetical protein [Vibrio porteresiae]|uniref:Lipoprotein n=1 Tax=Vibrio porteresiae DSM 19223 TaxID=1123496 RepID=A0ABZ0QD00_9VIBR|nr:hypothetical protein [Vibrio porteresiae]WPC74275.1 hypothetical protein R8Z52_03150 [Vibrio porteresiae DSM 19223]